MYDDFINHLASTCKKYSSFAHNYLLKSADFYKISALYKQNLRYNVLKSHFFYEISAHYTIKKEVAN